MPDALHLLLLTFAGWVNRHQEAVIDYLREENRILRENWANVDCAYPTEDSR